MDRNSIVKHFSPVRAGLKDRENWLLFLGLGIFILVSVSLVALILYTPAFADQPDTPLLLIDTVGEDEVIFLFTSSTGGGGGHSFDLYRCLGLVCTPTIQVGNNISSPYIDEGLTPQTDYCWLVEESHGQTTSISNIVCATTTGFGGGEPDMDIFTKRSGKDSITVTWLLPLAEKGNGFIFNYDIERSDDGGQSFFLIGQQSRQFERVAVDHNNDYREVYTYLDKDLDAGDIKIYKVSAKAGSGQGAGQIKYVSQTDPIRVPHDLTGFLIKANGYGIETQVSGTPQPPLMLGWFLWFMPNAFGIDNPIFTSLLNPQNEVFEIDIVPSPVPFYDADQCQQYLDISFKRNSDSGQTLEYIVTILDNGTARHQFTDTVQVTAKRVFNNQYFIPFEDQTITDFENITVQVDVNSQVGSPRSFELYGIDFFIPEDNGAC